MSTEQIIQAKEYLENNIVRLSEDIDRLIPLTSEVVRVSRIHKRTKSKKLIRYQIVVVSGNPEIGVIGIGVGKNVEYRLAIKEGISKSKKNLKLIKKGCGSHDCFCTEKDHSIPQRKKGKVGSTKVELIPGALKLGLRTSPVGKKLLTLGGIKDLMIVSRGNKNNKLNILKAIHEAI